MNVSLNGLTFKNLHCFVHKSVPATYFVCKNTAIGEFRRNAM